jgi:3-methyladenine DNA glycosylase AlkC
MAEPLKNQFGADVPRAIGAMLQAVQPQFPTQAFVRDCLAGYQALELMPRARHIAQALHRHLPPHFPDAVDLLLASLQQPQERSGSMAGFIFLPHCFYVAEHGLQHFDDAMRAQHALTQRFSAEFSIRPFLIRHPQQTLARLRQWASDPSEHVRRLVSEGTRPRLPWAPRLPAFQADPTPTLALLELLKDDPSLYVRRSVANHLGDIGKDHPQLLAGVAARWLADATPERRWVVQHALRWAVKQGQPWALQLMGFGQKAQVQIHNPHISPRRAPIGGSVQIRFDIQNTGRRRQKLLVDFQVHYIKANGATRAKVFKLQSLELAPGQAATCQKTLSLRQMTTRLHYPGRHRVEALVNGAPMAIGDFWLCTAER